MNEARISVIVAVYNREHTIDRCIDSIMFQTYQAFELILVDDFSTDGSMEKMLRWQERFPDRIRILTSSEKGVAHAKNTGITAARGDYLSFVDSDDWIDYRLFERLANALDGKVEMVYSPIWKIKGSQTTAFGKLPPQKRYTAYDYLKSENFCMVGRLIKRQLFSAFGLLPPLQQGEDLCWLYKAISHMTYPSAFAYVGTPGYYYEIHQDSICAQFDDASIAQDIVTGSDYILETVSSEYFEMALQFLLRRVINMRSRRTAHVRVFDEWISGTVEKYPGAVETITNAWVLSEIEKAATPECIPTTLVVNGFGRRYDAEKLQAALTAAFTDNRKDCRIVELSEENCDVHQTEWISRAYEQQRFDFVAKYFAAKFCYEEGGIFINHNMVIDSPCFCLLKDPCFFGYEDESHLTDDVFGCRPGSPLMKRILQTYQVPGMYDDAFAPLKDRIRTVLIGMQNQTISSGLVRNVERGYCLYPVEMFVYRLPFADCQHITHCELHPSDGREGMDVSAATVQAIYDRNMRICRAEAQKSTNRLRREKERYRLLANRRSEYIERIEQEKETLKRDKEELLNSFCWRITKPIRLAGRIVRKVVRR